ncbi:hypothetical protein EB796_007073 [Bugula neritina]|uniref:DH domain-containing protein n=1 Tax=Bugula neritina TaxID=10212 RepID=A0A7J7KAH6_BUGNE|nr:hypothetical protein EB796_007073 [Bugula neritina]
MKSLANTILTSEKIKLIFLNTEEIHTFHTRFYEELSQAVEADAVGDIAAIFAKNKSSFTLYARYCASLPAALEGLRDVLDHNNLAKTTIAELKKNLVKDKIFEIGSPPMKNIEKAIDVMQDIAYYVNEVKRDRESLDTITMIEQSIEDLSMGDSYAFTEILILQDYHLDYLMRENPKAFNEEHIPLPLPVFIKHNLRLNIVSLILHHPGELALPLEVNSFVRRKIGAGKSNAQSKQITPSLRMKWVPLKIRGNDFRYDKNLAEFAKESVKQCAQYAEDNHGSIECWSYADYQVYMLSYYKEPVLYRTRHEYRPEGYQTQAVGVGGGRLPHETAEREEGILLVGGVQERSEQSS